MLKSFLKTTTKQLLPDKAVLRVNSSMYRKTLWAILATKSHSLLFLIAYSASVHLPDLAAVNFVGCYNSLGLRTMVFCALDHLGKPQFEKCRVYSGIAQMGGVSTLAQMVWGTYFEKN